VLLLSGEVDEMAPAEPLQSCGHNLEALARTYSPALRSFFRRRILEHADVDDLVQDVFLHMARRVDLDDIANLEGYVFQTAANVLRDRLRKRFSHLSNAHEPISEDQPEDAVFSPERVLSGREAISLLQQALLELPQRTRLVFFLCRIEEISNADAAARIGISLSAVNKHMAKAMDLLMKRMRDQL
jgi:RNA polymerase sigma factor (sigma-70 family)